MLEESDRDRVSPTARSQTRVNTISFLINKCSEDRKTLRKLKFASDGKSMDDQINL